MKQNNAWDAVGFQRLDTKKREVKIKYHLDAFHNPDEDDKAYRNDETAQKTLPFLPDIAAVHQLVLNL